MKTRNLFVVILFMILFTGINMAQIWEKTNGPFGTYVNSIALHPNGDLYASCKDIGLFRSTDNGENWTFIGFENKSISKIFISASGYIFIDVEGIVYRSTDWAVSWHDLNLNHTSPSCIDDDNFGNIYITFMLMNQPDVILRSTDFGDTWSIWSTYSYGTFINDLLFCNMNSNIFLSDLSNGIYRLVNNNWVKSFPSIPGGLGTYCIEVTNGGALLAGTGNTGPYSTRQGIYKSVDNGVNWLRVISNGIENTDVYSIVINSAGTIFAGTTNGVFKSTDEGISWYEAGLQNFSVNKLLYKGQSLLWGIINGRIVKCDLLVNNWEYISLEAYVNHTFSLAYDQAAQTYYAATTNGVFRSTNLGESWDLVLSRWFGEDNSENILKVPLLIDHVSGNIFTIHYVKLFRSNDNGMTWESWFLPSTFNCLESGNEVGHFWGGGRAPSYYGGALYFSDDYGVTWNPNLNLEVVKCIRREVQSNVLFIGTSGDGIFKSTDIGLNWRKFSVGLQNDFIESIEINSTGDIYAGTHNGVYRSKDNGGNWKFVGLSSDTIITIAINSMDHILAGTMSGHVFISRDNGNTWNNYSSGLNATQVRCIVLDENDFALVGTAASGVYRSVNSTVDIRESENIIVTSFDLFQNYPNPFNPSTKISWQSPVGSQQTIKVFDVLGNEIATLVDEYKPAGRYEVEFQSAVGNRQLASGIYFYQLRAGEYTSVKKMILIR